MPMRFSRKVQIPVMSPPKIIDVQDKINKRVDLPKFAKSAFSVDDRIHVALPFDLAIQIGEILLESPRDNQMIVALGHQLKNLDENVERDLD